MLRKVLEDIEAKTKPYACVIIKAGEIIEIFSGWSFVRCRLSNGTIVNMSEKDYLLKTEKLKEFINEKDFKI